MMFYYMLMGPGILLLSIAAVIFITLALFIYYFKKNRNFVFRELKKSSVKSIDQILDNEYVVLIGKVDIHKGWLKAPLSQRECAAYHVSITETKQGIDEHWQVVDEVEYVDFILYAGKSKVLIGTGTDLKVVKSHIVMDFVEPTSVFGGAKSHWEAYLKIRGRSSKNTLGINKSMDFKEGAILPGDTIVAKGTARWEAIENPKDDSLQMKRLRLIGTETKKILITNDRKAISLLKHS